MRTTITTFLLLFICSTLFSQSFEVPKDYKLVAKEDYAPYEQDIVKCVDWLINTPVKMEQEKRKEASAFLFKWVNGSPTVHVVIGEKIVNFLDGPQASDFLAVFIGGWVKKTIETGNYKNTVAQAREDKDGIVAGNIAGIEAVIDFYNNNKKLLSKNKNIEEYINLKKKGKLKEYVEKNVSLQ